LKNVQFKYENKERNNICIAKSIQSQINIKRIQEKMQKEIRMKVNI